MVERSRQNDEQKLRDADLFGSSAADSRTMAMNLADQQGKPKFDESAFGLLKEGVASAVHSGVVEPIGAVGQLFGMEAPKQRAQADFGTASWYAQTIGSGAGMVAPFLLTQTATAAICDRIPMARGLVRPMALEGGHASFAARFTAPVAKSMIDGAIYGAVFSPSHDPNSSMLGQRFVNALSGGLTFGTQSAVSQGMMMGWGKLLGKEMQTSAFQHSMKGIGLRIGTNMVGGGFAGVVSAESHSLLSGHGLASADDVKKSVASFIVTGGALDAFHIAKDFRAQRKAAGESTTMQDAAAVLPVAGAMAVEARMIGKRQGEPATAGGERATRGEAPLGQIKPPSETLVRKSETLGRTVEAKLREIDPVKAPEQAADFNKLIDRMIERRGQAQSPREVQTAIEAVNRLLKAEQLEIPLSPQQRLGLAKQLLFEAANPRSVDQGSGYGCGPAGVLQIAQITNPGKHVSAIVDLVTTGKTTLPGGHEINLTQERLRQIDQGLGTTFYREALMPDAAAKSSLEKAAQSGVDPVIDGSASYSNYLGMLLYGNVRSQLLAPEGQQGIYVKGPKDRAVVEDTGERVVQIKKDGSVSLLQDGKGSPMIGPGVESRDLQRMYDAVTGRNSSKDNFVLLNTREPLQPHEGKRVLSARELEIALLNGDRPFIIEINGDALQGNQIGAATTASGRRVRHVVMVEPARDANGKQLNRDGSPLFDLIDTYGRGNDLVGKNALTARELFEAMRQHESPRIESPKQLEGIANFGEVDPAGVYRGRKPEGPEAMQSLKEKGVTLIIDMIENPKMEPGNTGRTQEQAWAEAAGIRYVNIKTSVRDLNPEAVQKVFDAVEAEIRPTDGRAAGKVFMHCARGADRTGTIAAMWRMNKMDGWTPRLALAEMREFGWNGHTPSTTRMGELVISPPKQFTPRTLGEPVTANEFRLIGARENPHSTHLEAIEAGKALADQPSLAGHPDLQAKVREINEALAHDNAPHLVSDGVTSILERVGAEVESGKFDHADVMQLLDAAHARAKGAPLAYDAFIDIMRDPVAASDMPLHELSALAELSKDASQGRTVLQMFKESRALMEGQARDSGYRPDLTGITPDLPQQRLTEVLQSLPPYQRADYVRELNRQWSKQGDVTVEARQKLLRSVLNIESAYQPVDALQPFKDLLSSNDTLTQLSKLEQRKLVSMITRASNPTRSGDVLNIMNAAVPGRFSAAERAQLLTAFNYTSEPATFRRVLEYADPPAMERLQQAGKANEVIERLLNGADDLPVNHTQLKREVYERFNSSLRASDFADPSSARFQNAIQYMPVEQLRTLDLEILGKAARVVSDKSATHIAARDIPSVAERIGDGLRARQSNFNASEVLRVMEMGPGAHKEIARAVSDVARSTSLARIAEMTEGQRQQFSTNWLKTIQELPAQSQPTHAYWLLRTMSADPVEFRGINIVKDLSNENLELMVKGFASKTSRNQDKALTPEQEATAYEILNQEVVDRWSDNRLVDLAGGDKAARDTANERRRVELHRTLARSISGDGIARLNSGDIVIIREDFAADIQKAIDARTEPIENTEGLKEFFASVRQIEQEFKANVIPEEFIPDALESIPPERHAEALRLLAERNSYKKIMDDLAVVERGLNGPVISRELQDALLGDMTRAERSAAIKVLERRMQYLSVKGMNDAFLELAKDLNDGGNLRYIRMTSRSRGQMQPAINTLMLGQATPGWEMAYHFHKATQIHNEFYRMEIDPKSEKPVVIDQSGNRYDLRSENGKLTASKMELRNGEWVATGDQLPMDRFVLFDNPHDSRVDPRIREKLQQLQGGDHLFVPEKIVGSLTEPGGGINSQRDINFLRIAQAEIDPLAAKKLAQDLKELAREEMRMSEKPPGDPAIKPIDEHQRFSLNRALRPSWHYSTEARLYKKFAELLSKTKETREGGEPYGIEGARELAAVAAHGLNYRQLSDVYEAARDTHRELTTNLRTTFGADLKPENVVYIVMNKEGSGYLVHEAYRRMNAESDFAVRPEQFVSEKDAMRMAENGELKDKVIVHLDDAFDFGADSAGKLKVLNSIKNAAQEHGAPLKGAAVATLFEFAADAGVHQNKTDVLKTYSSLVDPAGFVWAKGRRSQSMAEKISDAQNVGWIPPGDLSRYHPSRFENANGRPAATEIWPHLVPNDVNGIIESVLRETGQAGARANQKYELYVPLLNAMPEYFRTTAKFKGEQVFLQKAMELEAALRASVERARKEGGMNSSRLGAADKLAASLEYHLNRVTSAMPDGMTATQWARELDRSTQALRDFVEHAEASVKVVSRDHAPAQAALKLDLWKRDYLQFKNTHRDHSRGNLNYEFQRPISALDGSVRITAVRMTGSEVHVEGTNASGTPLTPDQSVKVRNELLEELRRSQLKTVIDGNAAARAQILAAYLDRMMPEGVVDPLSTNWESVGKPEELVDATVVAESKRVPGARRKGAGTAQMDLFEESVMDAGGE